MFGMPKRFKPKRLKPTSKLLKEDKSFGKLKKEVFAGKELLSLLAEDLKSQISQPYGLDKPSTMC